MLDEDFNIVSTGERITDFAIGCVIGGLVGGFVMFMIYPLIFTFVFQ